MCNIHTVESAKYKTVPPNIVKKTPSCCNNFTTNSSYSGYMENSCLGWTQKDLSEVTGYSLKTINQLINNKPGITPETAVTLEKVFNTPADFWIKVDAEYQIRKQKEHDAEKMN